MASRTFRHAVLKRVLPHRFVPHMSQVISTGMENRLGILNQRHPAVHTSSAVALEYQFTQQLHRSPFEPSWTRLLSRLFDRGARDHKISFRREAISSGI